jgi:hypothetical protein
MIKGSALKLPQPAACPLTSLHSLTKKDSSFCVVNSATQFPGEGRFLGDKKGEIKILTSKLISDITCLCKDLFEKGGQ